MPGKLFFSAVTHSFNGHRTANLVAYAILTKNGVSRHPVYTKGVSARRLWAEYSMQSSVSFFFVFFFFLLFHFIYIKWQCVYLSFQEKLETVRVQKPRQYIQSRSSCSVNLWLFHNFITYGLYPALVIASTFVKVCIKLHRNELRYSLSSFLDDLLFLLWAFQSVTLGQRTCPLFLERFQAYYCKRSVCNWTVQSIWVISPHKCSDLLLRRPRELYFFRVENGQKSYGHWTLIKPQIKVRLFIIK